MSAEVEVARQWIQKARNDLLNADNNLAAEETHFDTICFHCQQVAEKVLKGFLTGKGLVAPRTHDLLVLLEGVIELGPNAEALRETLIILQPYAIEVRYPDGDFTPSSEDAREARDAAGTILAWLERTFPEVR